MRFGGDQESVRSRAAHDKGQFGEPSARDMRRISARQSRCTAEHPRGIRCDKKPLHKGQHQGKTSSGVLRWS